MFTREAGERATHCASPYAGHAFQALVLAEHQIRAPFTFRAVPELITLWLLQTLMIALTVIVNLELQLSQAGFSCPPHPTGVLLLSLIWELLLVTVGG